MIRRSYLKYPIIKYSIVGLLGTGIHVGVLVLLVELFKVPAVTATTIGFVVTLLVSYVLNRNWTFEPTGEGSRTQFLKYLLVCSCGLLLNAALMYVTIHWIGWSYLIGEVLTTIIVPIHNYIWNRYWIFTVPQKRQKEAS
ncbi:GtrA family protein [Paenibacillus sp. BJ-4]|uniref:GtrA family protein n=1 Tax=Paenibacillus sp. BJ-4 TaxID=2878097 RepID=UPI001CF02665|nr:GtrA family protein [Paenibacillus sp. BJ-4]